MDKNKEYKFGIKSSKIYGKNKLILNYLHILNNINKKNNFYPGSPIYNI